MTISLLQKLLAGMLSVLLAAPLSLASPRFQSESAPTNQAASESQQEAASGAEQAQQTAPLEPRPQPNSDQSSPSQPAAGQQPSATNKPLGTAAAPYEKPSGVTGSRPAGAVIAPAKQRRVRAILIKIGIVVGAAAAVGAVVALSHASPSQPH